MGDGTFGRVLEAFDSSPEDDSKRRVAIKVVRDVERYTRFGKIEAEILRKVGNHDADDSHHCVKLWDEFMEGDHFCMVFEPLGPSLFELMQWNRYKGYRMNDIRVIARTTLEALRFLHRDLDLAHTDLKPENLLLKYPECDYSESRSTHFFLPQRGLVSVLIDLCLKCAEAVLAARLCPGRQAFNSGVNCAEFPLTSLRRVAAAQR